MMDESFDEFELLTEAEFLHIIQLFLCHAFYKSHNKLISAIASYVPNYKELFINPYKQVLIFLTFYRKWRLTGPFPEIKHYKFLLTLHDGVCGLLRSHQQYFKSMSRVELIKLVTGLRCLLGKAVLFVDKITVQDKKVFIMKMFPILPVDEKNKQFWTQYLELMDLDLTSKSELKIISKVNKIAINHLNERLLDLGRENARPVVEVNASFLAIFQTIDQKLTDFMNHVEKILPKDFLQNFTSKLKENQSDKVNAVTRSITFDSDETQLIDLYQKVKNYYIQSQFWARIAQSSS